MFKKLMARDSVSHLPACHFSLSEEPFNSTSWLKCVGKPLSLHDIREEGPLTMLEPVMRFTRAIFRDKLGLDLMPLLFKHNSAD